MGVLMSYMTLISATVLLATACSSNSLVDNNREGSSSLTQEQQSAVSSDDSASAQSSVPLNDEGLLDSHGTVSENYAEGTDILGSDEPAIPPVPVSGSRTDVLGLKTSFSMIRRGHALMNLKSESRGLHVEVDTLMGHFKFALGGDNFLFGTTEEESSRLRNVIQGLSPMDCLNGGVPVPSQTIDYMVGNTLDEDELSPLESCNSVGESPSPVGGPPIVEFYEFAYSPGQIDTLVDELKVLAEDFDRERIGRADQLECESVFDSCKIEDSTKIAFGSIPSFSMSLGEATNINAANYLSKGKGEPGLKFYCYMDRALDLKASGEDCANLEGLTFSQESGELTWNPKTYFEWGPWEIFIVAELDSVRTTTVFTANIKGKDLEKFSIPSNSLSTNLQFLPYISIVESVDWNNDGLMDILGASSRTGMVSLHLYQDGIQDNPFQEQWSVPAYTAHQAVLNIPDFGSDPSGPPILARHVVKLKKVKNQEQVVTLSNQGHLRLGTVDGGTITWVQIARRVSDFQIQNTDDDPEMEILSIIASSDGSYSIGSHELRGNRAQVSLASLGAEGSTITSPFYRDINGDGFKDLGAYDVSISRLKVLYNDGNEGYSPVEEVNMEGHADRLAFHYDDLNYDGKLDMIILSDSRLSMFYGVEKSIIKEADFHIDLGDRDVSTSIDILDFNNDGAKDILTSSYSSSLLLHNAAAGVPGRFSGDYEYKSFGDLGFFVEMSGVELTSSFILKPQDPKNSPIVDVTPMALEIKTPSQ